MSQVEARLLTPPEGLPWAPACDGGAVGRATGHDACRGVLRAFWPEGLHDELPTFEEPYEISGPARAALSVSTGPGALPWSSAA